MELELKSRLCGDVHVVECKGRIVAGDEATALESVLLQDTRRHLSQVVLHVGEVFRLDSTGLGLLVRYSTNLRRRFGDLRLASPPSFMTDLLELTKVSSLVQTFPTEDEAILSFLKQQRTSEPRQTSSGHVLVIDPSGDFCSFVRALLTQHGFGVQLASVPRDARILLQVHTVDCIIVGPNISQPAADSVASSMQALSPHAKVIQLDAEFKSRDAHEAAQILLQMIKPAA